jgi:hypothetical protein
MIEEEAMMVTETNAVDVDVLVVGMEDIQAMGDEMAIMPMTLAIG